MSGGLSVADAQETPQFTAIVSVGHACAGNRPDRARARQWQECRNSSELRIQRSEFRISSRGFVARDLDEVTVLDAHAGRERVARALSFGAVHQLVRALQQLGCELARDRSAVF